MPKTLAELDAAIDHFALRLPDLLDATRPEDWIDAFAGEADIILDAAAPEDIAHVNGRLQCLLRDNGLIPGDDLPCDSE